MWLAAIISTKEKSAEVLLATERRAIWLAAEPMTHRFFEPAFSIRQSLLNSGNRRPRQVVSFVLNGASTVEPALERIAALFRVVVAWLCASAQNASLKTHKIAGQM